MMFAFAFGEPGTKSMNAVDLGIPLLEGERMETIVADGSFSGTRDGVTLWEGASGLAGWARTSPAGDIEGSTRRVYARLLESSKGLNLYRIWNSVPKINADDPKGLENYRAFCRGRSLAFEAALGSGFSSSLPASTAVGTAGGAMTVVFLAGPRPARHVENPAQIPAYEYPPEHGPRPPSFARATVVEGAIGLDVFISGTSSIVGHATVAPNDTRAQVDCTLENLRLVSTACGLGDDLGAGRRRHFKVYLRRSEELTQVAERLRERMLRPGDRISYLGADICRSALNVEIEVAVRGSESM